MGGGLAVFFLARPISLILLHDLVLLFSHANSDASQTCLWMGKTSS